MSRSVNKGEIGPFKSISVCRAESGILLDFLERGAFLFLHLLRLPATCLVLLSALVAFFNFTLA